MNTKLTDYTLQRAYAERDNFNKRPKWLSQLIDIISIFIPFLVANTKHYRNKVVKDGFSDLESFWKHGYKQHSKEKIEKVIHGMNQFKDFMTDYQQKRFDQLNTFVKILPTPEPFENKDSIFGPIDNSDSQSVHTIDTDTGDNLDLSVEYTDEYTVELPYNILFGKFDSLNVPLKDLLRWYNHADGTDEFWENYLDTNSKTILDQFENDLGTSNLRKKLITSLELFSDIMTPKVDHLTINNNELSDKLKKIEDKSPALYNFFFNPADKKKKYFISNPFIFKVITTALNYNDAKTLIVAFTFLTTLMPLDKTNPIIDYANQNEHETFLAFSQLISGDGSIERKIMLSFIFNICIFDEVTSFYLDQNIGLSDDDFSQLDIEDESSILFNSFKIHINQMLNTYTTIYNLKNPPLGSGYAENTPYHTHEQNKTPRVVELRDEVDKENSPQSNIKSSRNGLFDGSPKPLPDKNPTAFETPGHHTIKKIN